MAAPRPTEAVNLLIKKVKRVGHGFRNFDNYRLRRAAVLRRQLTDLPDRKTARSRSPRFVARSLLSRMVEMRVCRQMAVLSETGE